MESYNCAQCLHRGNDGTGERPQKGLKFFQKTPTAGSRLTMPSGFRVDHGSSAHHKAVKDSSSDCRSDRKCLDPTRYKVLISLICSVQGSVADIPSTLHKRHWLDIIGRHGSLARRRPTVELTAYQSYPSEGSAYSFFGADIPIQAAVDVNLHWNRAADGHG